MTTTLSSSHLCRCSVHPTEGLIVNCSSTYLPALPYLSRDVAELHLSDTGLSTLPPGLFDKLVGLKKISISENPFHCDCRIQYLRNWLVKNRDKVTKEPTCASPGVVTQKNISELSDAFFSSCSKPNCANGIYFIVTCAILLCVLALIVYTLRLAKESTITLYIDERHALFEAHSLRSQKPKHRRRLSCLKKPEPLETPLLNVEPLPEALDTQQQQHNKLNEKNIFR
uniref:LRRCT domain-containing protein n=1 Tax=Periophthalmus magnuspinnatus TaxID=409849 RepID=A0A3B4AXQ0_9GOBI